MLVLIEDNIDSFRIYVLTILLALLGKILFICLFICLLIYCCFQVRLMTMKKVLETLEVYIIIFITFLKSLRLCKISLKSLFSQPIPGAFEQNFVYLFIYLFTYLFIYLFTYLFISLFTYLFIFQVRLMTMKRTTTRSIRMKSMNI